MAKGAAAEGRATYVISAAAELAGMHPQTLRQYDRLGLVTPERAPGKGRRYSAADIRRLRQIQRMSQEQGINLAGVRQILALEDELAAARAQVQELTRRQAEGARSARQGAPGRVFAIDRTGQVAMRSPHVSQVPGWNLYAALQLRRRLLTSGRQ